MSEISITDRDIYVLKKFGLNKKDILFLTKYMDEKDFFQLIGKLKKADALEHRNELKQKTIEQINKQNERNHQKECKCAVGAVIINEMFNKGIIQSYDDILLKGTNILQNDVQDFLKKYKN